jgi:hypothetical protein
VGRRRPAVETCGRVSVRGQETRAQLSGLRLSRWNVQADMARSGRPTFAHGSINDTGEAGGARRPFSPANGSLLILLLCEILFSRYR